MGVDTIHEGMGVMAIRAAAEEGRPQQKRAPAAIRIATFALMIMEIGTPAKGMVHCAR